MLRFTRHHEDMLQQKSMIRCSFYQVNLTCADDSFNTKRFNKVTAKTRLPSKPTTRECVHLVRRSHFRSRDKDGSQTIRSAIVENPMTTPKRHGSMFYRNEVIADGSFFYIAGIGILDLFGSCDLELDLMTFIYELGPYSLEIYRMFKYELPMSKPSKVIV